nr:unnamed protein product [Callosobruchus analis]
MFINTLGIRKGVLDIAMQNRTEENIPCSKDRRGKGPKNVTPPEVLQGTVNDAESSNLTFESLLAKPGLDDAIATPLRPLRSGSASVVLQKAASPPPVSVITSTEEVVLPAEHIAPPIDDVDPPTDRSPCLRLDKIVLMGVAAVTVGNGEDGSKR